MLQAIIDWANQNEGVIALLTFTLISILVPLSRVFLKRIEAKVSRSVDEDEIRRIEQIRAEFYSNLKFIDKQTAYGRFLIRDISREQLYFDGDEPEFDKKGAPPSYRVQLVDMSVHGVRVAIGWPERIKSIEDGSTWCLADEDDEGGKLVFTIATIPFSSIVAVNWHGDPAYTHPHIFCRYDQKHGWPYKKVEYCESIEMREGFCLYDPIVEVDQVVRRNF